MVDQDPNSWKREAEKRYKEKLVGTRYKLREGDNAIRILPRKNADGSIGGVPYHEFLIHREVGPQQRTITCAKDITGKGSCWLCDVLIPKLKDSTKPGLRKRAAAMGAVEQFMVQVTALDSGGQFTAPLAWMMNAGGSRTLSTQILGLLMKTKRDYVSLSKGYNLNIERTGSGLSTRYGVIEPDAEPTAVTKSVVQRMKTLEELVDPYSVEKQKSAYFNREDADEDEDADVGETELDSKASDDDEAFDDEDSPVDDEEDSRPSAEDEQEADQSIEDAEAASDDDELSSVEDLFDEPEEGVKAVKSKPQKPQRAQDQHSGGKNSKPVAKPKPVGKRRYQ